MKFITCLTIERFRSIHEVKLDGLSDFSALCGLNNSGKSNVLRALHLFFAGEVEPGLPLNFSRDFFREELQTKKRKRISVEVSFSLPPSFKFRQDLAAVEKLVGKVPRIRKEWAPDAAPPAVFLNGDDAPLNAESAQKIESFLRLISIRFIPNRVVPTHIISREHGAIRDVLVRRLAKYKGQSAELFKAIEKASHDLILDVATELKAASPGLTNLSLATATSLADLAFKFGYQLHEGNIRTSEEEQGSGIQSLLMFRTLSLIDQDFFKQFGWKQAALWLIEEPESSLHASLEAQVAFLLSQLASNPKGRLQAITTTHSDLVVQYSTQSYLVSKAPIAAGKPESKSVVQQRNKMALVREAAEFGISRWVNPILFYPLDHVLLVEGKFDVDFIQAANLALGLVQTYKVVSLAHLLDDQVKGGVDYLLSFIKQNATAIKTRPATAKIGVLLDWDCSNKLGGIAGYFKADDPFAGIAWSEPESNPKLDKTFRGIERFMSTRVIDEADKTLGNLIGKKGNGVYTIAVDDFQNLKQHANAVVKKGLLPDDALFAKPLLSALQAQFVK